MGKRSDGGEGVVREARRRVEDGWVGQELYAFFCSNAAFVKSAKHGRFLRGLVRWVR